MSVWLAMLIGGCIGVVITTLILSNTRNGRIQAEYEKYIAELNQQYEDLTKYIYNKLKKVLPNYRPHSVFEALDEYEKFIFENKCWEIHYDDLSEKIYAALEKIDNNIKPNDPFEAFEYLEEKINKQNE